MKILLTLSFSCFFLSLFAQNFYNPIYTSVPFMNTDSETGTIGFGGIGVVATPNNYTSTAFQNPSLYSQGDYQFGMINNFSLQELTYLSFYSLSSNAFFKIGKNAFALHTRFFNWPDVLFIDENGNPLPGNTASEIMTGVSYSRAFSKAFSIGFTTKFVQSKFAGDYYKGNVFAVDVGANYRKQIMLDNDDLFSWQVGLAINNLGNKFCYNCESSASSLNIPTVLRLGGLWSYKMPLGNTITSLSLAYQADKLLVPTPNFVDTNQNGIFDYLEKSALQGILGSFTDAPNGAREEWAEITHKVGVENEFYFKKTDLSISILGGLWAVSEKKGRDKALTLGASINWKGVKVSYARIIKSDFLGSDSNIFGLSYLHKPNKKK